MASNKDYYQILGINRNASFDEIKQAYRKLAREHHPDMVKDGDKAAAEQRFKEINEAYQILSDPQKRKMYDQFGSAAFTGAAAGAQGSGGFGGFSQGKWGPFTYTYSTSPGGNAQDFGFGDFDPFDVFEQFFGFRGFGGARNVPRKGKNLYYEMRLDFAQAVFGLEKEIKIESGKVTIKIPAGVRDGTEIRFSGHGMPSPVQGGQSGDLFITVRVSAPKEFEFYGEHIVVKKEISFVTAILGGEIEIPTVDLNLKTGVGVTRLKIPEGTQHGTQFLLRGKGMPRFRGRGQSDVIVAVSVVIPKRVSRQQRELLEQFGV